MKIKLKLISFIIFNSLAFSGTTGKLVGKIMDKDTGNPLIGCNVIIEDTYMGTSSNELGEYILLNIPPWNYNVRFEMIGYKRVINDGVTIISDKTITLNGDLVSSVIEGEEVIVLAEKKLFQRKLISIHLINYKHQYLNLPNYFQNLWESTRMLF